MLALLLCLAPFQAFLHANLQANLQANQDALAREWWVRAVAQAPETHARALSAELVQPAWRARATALDALLRAAELGAPTPSAWREEARRALADAHPNVRARALAAHAALGEPLAPEVARALALEPLASLRVELARALEFAPCPGRAALLAELGQDPDERVRVAARTALAGLPGEEPGVGAARLALLRHARGAGEAQLARLLTSLVHAPLAPGWIGEARAEFGAHGLDAERRARALFEAASFAASGAGEAPLLVAGFTQDEDWLPEHAHLALLAARARRPELARAALRALAGVAPDGRAWRGLVGLAVDTLAPAELLALAREEAAAPALLAALLEELGLRVDRLAFALYAPLCAPSQPLVVRRAVLAAAAGAFARAPEPEGARLLALFLADPATELGARAFEVLCETRAPDEATAAALHAAYLRLAPEERVRRMGWFARERPLAPFRDEWLALGARGGELRAAACELLAGFTGDEGVQRELVRWLEQDLAQAARASEVARDLEQLVQAELRALGGVAPEAAVPALAAALDVALGRSSEIGKLAVAGLGRSDTGRALLEARLEAGAFAPAEERRLRIEACIVLARGGGTELGARVCRQLLEDREGAAWDLRERMLRALQASGTAVARAGLESLVLQPELAAVERTAVAALLDARASRAVLRRLARGPFELEVRGVALRALAAGGAEGAQGADAEGLLALFAELTQGSLPGTAEELAFLRGELLVGLASLSAPPAALGAEWLRAPLAQAAHELTRRFAGSELPATEFAWRHELELARVLARRTRAGAALAQSGAFERLDARLLFALGEACEQEGEAEAAERLFSAAQVALAGERDADPSLAALMRARRFALAWRLGDWERTAYLGERTLSARRAGRFSATRWAQLFGAFDAEAGIDPDARVRATLWQARARAALARGEVDAARVAAGRAAEECGGSRLARAAQAELEQELLAAAAGR